MSHANKVIGGILPCYQIVIVHIDRVIHIGTGLADNHKGNLGLVHIGNQWIIQGGVEEHKALHQLLVHKPLDIFQHLLVGFPGNNCSRIALLHGPLADTSNGTGYKGIVIALLCLGPHDDADAVAWAAGCIRRICFIVCCIICCRNSNLIA